MKSKLVGILICVMMLATVLPITAMATTLASEPQKETTGLFDKTIVRGIVIFKRTSDGGNIIHFYALRVHYLTIKVTGEHESGVLRMQSISMPNGMTGFYGRMFVFASFRGSLTF